MDFKRYSLIVRRWVWFLAIAVGCAAIFTWFFLNATGLTRTPTETAALVLLVTVAGLVWGLVGILGIEALIDNVKAVEDVRKITSAPLLGIVELGGHSGHSDDAPPFIVFEDRAPAPRDERLAEAFRRASRTLLPAGPSSKGSTLLVCAPQPPQSSQHTGKVGANLAAATALAGHPTLLIDASRVEGELSSAPSIADHLGFGDTVSKPRGEMMLHLVPSIPNLHVLPVDMLSGDGPLTFSGTHLGAVLDRSGAHGSVVVIVGPPAGAQPHDIGMRLARAVDEVVLLTVAEETKRKALRSTVHALQANRVRLAGIIFVQPAKSRRSRVQAAISSLSTRPSDEPHPQTPRGYPAPTAQDPASRAFASSYREPSAAPPNTVTQARTAQASPYAQGLVVDGQSSQLHDIHPARPEAATPSVEAGVSTPGTLGTERAREAPGPVSAVTYSSRSQSVIPVKDSESGERALHAESKPAATYAYDAPLWRRLFDVGTKWVALFALAIRTRATGRYASRTGQPRKVSVMSRAGRRAQLAGAHIIRAIAVRRSGAVRNKVEGRTPAYKLIEAAVPESERPGGNEERVVEALLKAAERAHNRGNYRDAKELVDRVLDRDPRNETAWQMRLQLPEIAPPPAMRLRAETYPAVPVQRPTRQAPVALLVVVLVVASLGVAGYFLWPDISRTANELGERFAPSPPNSLPATATPPTTTPSPRSEPSYDVSSPFSEFWDSKGGAAIFGTPISPRITEIAPDGQRLEVQYFERARFELAVGADGVEKVTLGRIGAEVPVTGTVANPLPEGLQGETVTFDDAGILTPQRFFEFWQSEGGVEIFGFPISPVLIVTSPSGQPMAVQYFERARFEYHPEGASDDKQVQLSPLGSEVYRSKYGR